MNFIYTFYERSTFFFAHFWMTAATLYLYWILHDMSPNQQNVFF